MKRLVLIFILASTPVWAQEAQDYQAAMAELSAQRNAALDRAMQAAVQLAAKDREIAKLKADAAEKAKGDSITRPSDGK